MNRKPTLNPARGSAAVGLALIFLSLISSLGSIVAQEVSEEAAPVVEESATPTQRIIYGQIDGEITLAESAYVNRLLEKAKVEEADVLLIELNTFGGRVDAAVAIRDSLLDAELQTVIFINKRAISAGALISLACNKIAISSGGTIGAATPVVMAPGQEPEAVQEKYLSYFRQEMRSTAEATGRSGELAEAMVDASKQVDGISEEGELLTLNTRTALEHKMVELEADSVEEVLAGFGIEGEVLDLQRSWSEQVVAFLTSPAIASLLLAGMLLLGYFEFHTPGFGFFGAGAIVCFLLLFYGHHMVNLAGHEELLLFVVGIVLIAIELLVVPGIGILVAVGTGCVLASMVLILLAGDWSDFSLDNPFTLDAMQQVSASLVLGFVVSILAMRYLIPADARSSRGGLILNKVLTADDGYTSHKPPEESSSLVGQTGIAASQLRPGGKAVIDGKRMNVETEGDWVEKGAEIIVTRRVEGRVVVRQA